MWTAPAPSLWIFGAATEPANLERLHRDGTLYSSTLTSAVSVAVGRKCRSLFPMASTLPVNGSYGKTSLPWPLPEVWNISDLI